MSLNNQSILFFARTMCLGGTENVVLQQIEALKPYVKKIVVCSCGGINVEKLSSMGVKHYQIPDITKKDFVTMISVMKILNKIINQEEITIIHTEHRMAAFYVSFMRLYEKCQFINTSHNTFVSKKVMTRFAYKHANIIACGEMVKKNLCDLYEIPDNQVTVIHNAIKPFTNKVVDDPLIKTLHKQGYFVVGNIGRLSEQKGMEYFIDSILRIKEKHPMIKFVIIGTGELEDVLKNRVNSRGLNGDVIFMGYRSDVQNVMSQIDLVVLSSLWEGFPLTPIEAFSVGKTIVATGVDGTVEIVENEKNGLIVEPRQSSQIADAITRFIEDENFRKECEYEAKKLFEREYSFEKFSEEHRNYYLKLLENRL